MHCTGCISRGNVGAAHSGHCSMHRVQCCRCISGSDVRVHCNARTWCDAMHRVHFPGQCTGSTSRDNALETLFEPGHQVPCIVFLEATTGCSVPDALFEQEQAVHFSTSIPGGTGVRCSAPGVFDKAMQHFLSNTPCAFPREMHLVRCKRVYRAPVHSSKQCSGSIVRTDIAGAASAVHRVRLHRVRFSNKYIGCGAALLCYHTNTPGEAHRVLCSNEGTGCNVPMNAPAAVVEVHCSN